MSTEQAPENDIAFLKSLAERLSQALYYDQLGPIGTDGNVSSGLTHDDYDRLRALAKRMQIASLEAQLDILRSSR